MVTVPLGVGAYKRTYGGEPEIKLINRFVEKNIANQREHITLLARLPASLLVAAGTGPIRCLYSKQGLFNSDLFIVSGTSFYRYTTSGVLTQIAGTVANNGFTYAAWMKGIGYEFLFLSDGQHLQYYTTRAMGTLTLTLNALDGNITNQVIDINGVYYGWGSNVEANTPAGTSGHPWLAAVGTPDKATGQTADSISLANMAALISGSGVSGVNYSTNAPADGNVTATSTATTLTATAILDQDIGNAITTTVPTGSYLAWGAGTLTGGGNQALQAIAMPNSGELPKALAPISSFVFVSVAGQTKFYWIQPGAVVINALDFASKESNPDPIIDMTLVGDSVLISGEGSAENWYATGDLINPFAPIQGRVYRRGVLDGTPVVVKDSVFLVGDDGVVYQIGYQYGSTAQWGVNPVSDHGIEERIRTQIRTLNGWPA